jgi:predicted ATPase/class 3 adenylate cyclase
MGEHRNGNDAARPEAVLTEGTRQREDEAGPAASREEYRDAAGNLAVTISREDHPGAVPVPDPTEPLLTIRLFGPFEALLNGAPLSGLRRRQARWLLALLALRAGREVERPWLAGLLWPETAEATALKNLRSSLADLRQALGPAAARLRSPAAHTLCLDLTGVEADVLAFDAAIAAGDDGSLERAATLYRGPLLEGCAEEWALQERQARERAYLEGLETLAARALARGERRAAERHLRRAVSADPLLESAQRALMQALVAEGNYAGAVLAYRELRLRLHQEINTEPDPETKALFQQLRAEVKEKAGARDQGSGVSKVNDHASLSAQLTPGPTGTITFLFTDIEGSTRLWEEHPEAMREALGRHDALLREAIGAHHGRVFKTVGDQFCAAFATAPEALAAALTGQRALQAERWPGTGPLRVRMALHTGTAEAREGDYLGPPLNRIARLLEAGHGGQILLSLATQELVRDHLPGESSLRDLEEHRLKDLTRPERVFQLLHPDLQANNFPPLRSLAAFTHNLPAQLTSFIGREQAMAEVKDLLSTTRLLTLTGSGGCGKTRLALQAAADLLEEYPDGVWLVELAALADPALVPQSVAAALGVREEPNRPLLATLVDYLRPKSLLLVVDNCEHLLEACAQLADSLLRTGPELRILASSREGLGIAGERTYRVPSLSLPPVAPTSQSAPSPSGSSALLEYEAVRLFVERAVFTQPGFVVTDQNALALAQVCQRLDGIPLALELAAARVKALPVEKLNERLDDMFRLLTGGSRTALPRQQTLRALIDWSYDLLAPPEQALLRRLSVFAGGWILEAAEAVCADARNEERGMRNEIGSGSALIPHSSFLIPEDVLDLLSSLVEKSLVLYEAGEARYWLLETVRQYARDRLLETGEAAAVRGRHRDWCMALAEDAGERFRGPTETAWLERLEREHDNLRAALAWSVAQGQGATGLRLGGALGRFWAVRGYWTEGREHLAELLTLPGAEDRTVERARVLLGAGELARYLGDWRAAWALIGESLAISRELDHKRGTVTSLNFLGWIAQQQQGDFRAARALHEESLAISRELGDQRSIAASLHGLGGAAHAQGEHEAARTLFEENLASFRELGDKHGIVVSLMHLGQIARDRGDFGAARARFEESLAIFRELGTKEGIAWSLDNLGRTAYGECDFGAAQALFEESAALRREIGSKTYLAWPLLGLGDVARLEHDFETARSHYEEALAIGRELELQDVIGWAVVSLAPLLVARGELEQACTLARQGVMIWRAQQNKIGMVQSLEALAGAAYASGQPERMARLFGAAEALRETLHNPLQPADQVGYEVIPAARAALGEAAFRAAWAEGQAMSLDQAIELALNEALDG